jgi:hypothetical protein
LPELNVAEMTRDPRQKAAIRRLKREVKYVAGKDNKWFTPDDYVCRYYPVQYDKEGKMIKKSYFEEGGDSRAFNKDDVLMEYQVFQYGPNDRIDKEIVYDGKKKKLYTAVYEYDARGKKIRTRRYDPTGNEVNMTEYRYGSDGVLQQDVEYVRGKVVKYHRFMHDHEKQYGQVTEFDAESESQGPDGIWFTRDDTVSAAKECFYNPDYTKASEKKYLESGPDKKWFTKDDVMQYYTVFEYETIGARQ